MQVQSQLDMTNSSPMHEQRATKTRISGHHPIPLDGRYSDFVSAASHMRPRVPIRMTMDTLGSVKRASASIGQPAHE